MVQSDAALSGAQAAYRHLHALFRLLEANAKRTPNQDLAFHRDSGSETANNTSHDIKPGNIITSQIVKMLTLSCLLVMRN